VPNKGILPKVILEESLRRQHGFNHGNLERKPYPSSILRNPILRLRRLLQLMEQRSQRSQRVTNPSPPMCHKQDQSSYIPLSPRVYRSGHEFHFISTRIALLDYPSWHPAHHFQHLRRGILEIPRLQIGRVRKCGNSHEARSLKQY
jgi:hypothetical protein